MGLEENSNKYKYHNKKIKMAKYHHIPILTENIQKHLSCLSFFLCADANLQMQSLISGKCVYERPLAVEANSQFWHGG